MGDRRLRIGCEFTYEAAIRTPTVFQVQANDEPRVKVLSEEWRIDPEVDSHGYRDLYDNPCLRVVLPQGMSTLTYEALAVVPDAVEDFDEDAPEIVPERLPDDVLIYTLPSRYVLPDMLADQSWSRFGSTPTGYRRVQEITQHVHDHLTFSYGSSLPTSTALDVYTSGYGVCRDFTHLAISFCRALNIPARYVFGYLPDLDTEPSPDPMDFAAWMEVWLGDRWWTFDPRNNRRLKGRVVVGRGRDASDVAMATTFGGPTLHSMVVHAEEAQP
ncbi:transglutaminase family protein [Umezawaea endophytica]|uniref:Transglutaminase family protein n=1 Tax=Umezawaea endophytica TaxID=1654476 RepID=A0A9X3AHZ8_9PSEU|nr:transglutaminase family protein [Umezawaea endophytica]MCS7481831.1 transglutaminase family protein [Umezawaea endophytica]